MNQEVLLKQVKQAVLCDYDPQFQEPLVWLWEAASLVLMVGAVWEVVRRLAVRLMEESLTVRAQQPETWPVCGRCGRRLQSKGFHPRVLCTLFGGGLLAAAGRTVSKRLQGLAGCAVGSGVGVGGAPTHGGGSAVDGRSIGGICAL
jgi:hypothetical protein